MKLEQLQHIIEIEKQKSISKAAKALYIGQPTLSGSLTALEEEIGVKLFERTYTGVVPTEEGKKAVHLAKQALDAVYGIQNLGRKQEGLTGTVTVLIGQVYSYLYNDILLNFKQRYPEAELKLFVRTHEEIMSEMQKGNAEIALCPIVEISLAMLQSNLKKQDCVIETFGDYTVKVFAGFESGYAGRQEIGTEELRKEQLLAGFEEWASVIEKWVQPEKPVITIVDNESMKQMICNSKGIALSPEIYEKQNFYCEKGEVQVLSLRDNIAERMIGGIITRKRKSILEERTVQLLKELI